MNFLGSLGGGLLAVGTVFLLVLFVMLWVGTGVTRAREEVADRLALYGRDQVVTGAREDQLAKPLAQRTVGPLFLRFSSFLKRFTPAGYLEKIEHQLLLGGNPGNLDAPAFVVIKLLTTGLGLFAAFYLVDFGADTLQRVVLFGMPIALGFFGPTPGFRERSTTVGRPCFGRFPTCSTFSSSPSKRVLVSTRHSPGSSRPYPVPCPKSSSGCFRRQESV